MVETALLPLTDDSIPLRTTWQKSWEAALEAWGEELLQRTGSDRTPHEYSRHLARFWAATQLTDPRRATSAHVQAWAYAPGPSGRPPRPSTVMVRLAAVRSFYDFAQRMGLFTGDNPTLRVKRPKQQQPLPQGLSWPALRRLLAAIPPHTRSGCRDRAIVLTILLTGLRRREVLSLTAGDLTHTGAVVYTARTKGGVTRRRELPVPALEAIRAAWERQGQPLCALSAQTRLFPVTPGGFAKNLARYARRAGLGHLSPHALRHSAAKLRRVTGASIEEVSHLLGHANLATTAIYLSRLEGEADSGWHAAAALLLGEPPS